MEEKVEKLEVRIAELEWKISEQFDMIQGLVRSIEKLAEL